MKTIYKYKLNTEEIHQTLELPKGAQILSVQNQNDELCLWALVETNKPTDKFEFFIIPTGSSVFEDYYTGKIKFLNTVQFRYQNNFNFVIHVFQVLS